METMVRAYEDKVRGFAQHHPVDQARVKAIVERVQAVGRWDLPPVLVIEDRGNGHQILDGHHRTAAAEMLEGAEHEYLVADGIPAWVVAAEDVDQIVEDVFGGEFPDRCCDLRNYIDCGGVDGNSFCEHGVDVAQ